MNALTEIVHRPPGRSWQLDPFELEPPVACAKAPVPEAGCDYGCVDWYVYEHPRSGRAPGSATTLNTVSAGRTGSARRGARVAAA
jgi:hypothetical protein